VSDIKIISFGRRSVLSINFEILTALQPHPADVQALSSYMHSGAFQTELVEKGGSLAQVA